MVPADVTVEAAGVRWLDLFVTDEDTRTMNGLLSVEDPPVTLTLSPPGAGERDYLFAESESDRLEVINGIADWSPGEYTVLVRGPGTDGVVRDTATVTIESG